jgi:hypothetical protein
VLRALNLQPSKCLTDGTLGMEVPFFEDRRFKLVMAGERAGKSFTGAMYAVAQYE